MIKLEDSQIWESDTGVVQVQAMGKSFGDFRGIIFSKKGDGSIHYVSMIFNEKNRLVDFIESLNMTNTGRSIITREKVNAQ